MKKAVIRDILLLSSFVLMTESSYAQPFSLQWAKKAGGTLKDGGYAVASDGADNIVVAGFFMETITFGAGEANQTILVSAGENDIFIAKYSPSGVLLWAKKAGGKGRDLGYGVTTDHKDNVLVTGHFFESVVFAAGETNETILIGSGNDDIFVAKYAPNGGLVWVKNAGGIGNEGGFGIAMDSTDNILVTGYFFETALFGVSETNETILISEGYNDIFIAKYSPSGDLLWAKKAGGSLRDVAYGIATDRTGNILVTGRSWGTAVFGSGEDNETILISEGYNDIFIAKYTPSGLLQWAKKAGGPSFDDGYGIVADNSGNIMVTGFFCEKATFGAGEANETILVSKGELDFDVFLAKYNPDGVLQWAKQAGGPDMDAGKSITTDGSNNILMTGYFRETITFGVKEVNDTTMICDGVNDIFVVKYSPDGVLQWVRRIGGAHLDAGYGIAMDGSGNILVTGLFSETVTFGIDEANESILTSDGYNDFFVARFSGDDGGATGIDDRAEKALYPAGNILEQNYPNPVNPVTTIPLEIPHAGHSSLAIYNLKGQVVRTLYDCYLQPGNHSVLWDGKSDSGEVVASGIYLYKLKGENYEEIRKLIFVQ